MKICINWKRWLPCVMIAAVLCGMIGNAYAKYVKQDKLEGSVTIKAELGTIELWEHLAEDLDGDGEYTLNTTKEVTSNTYKLLPGLDVPKDPFIRITGKTPIEAYVFLKVVTNIQTDNKDMNTDENLGDDHNVSYTLTANWLKIKESTAGDVTTAVYVYSSDGTTPAKVDETFGTNGTGIISVLKDNTIYVSQKLNVPTAGVYLNFSACMYEVASAEKTGSQSDLDHAGTIYSQYNP